MRRDRVLDAELTRTRICSRLERADLLKPAVPEKSALYAGRKEPGHPGIGNAQSQNRVAHHAFDVRRLELDDPRLGCQQVGHWWSTSSPPFPPWADRAHRHPAISRPPVVAKVTPTDDSAPGSCTRGGIKVRAMFLLDSHIPGD